MGTADKEISHKIYTLTTKEYTQQFRPFRLVHDKCEIIVLSNAWYINHRLMNFENINESLDTIENLSTKLC